MCSALRGRQTRVARARLLRSSPGLPRARPPGYSRRRMTPPLDLPGLRDRIVLVTGSSRGIGEGLIRASARCGARCVVNYVDDPAGRNRADAERVATEIGAALTVECDVSDYDAVGRMMDRVQQALGGLDILVNNAGVVRDRTLKKMTPQDWQAVLQVNLT